MSWVDFYHGKVKQLQYTARSFNCVFGINFLTGSVLEIGEGETRILHLIQQYGMSLLHIDTSFAVSGHQLANIARTTSVHYVFSWKHCIIMAWKNNS